MVRKPTLTLSPFILKATYVNALGAAILAIGMNGKKQKKKVPIFSIDFIKTSEMLM